MVRTSAELRRTPTVLQWAFGRKYAIRSKHQPHQLNSVHRVRPYCRAEVHKDSWLLHFKDERFSGYEASVSVLFFQNLNEENFYDGQHHINGCSNGGVALSYANTNFSAFVCSPVPPKPAKKKGNLKKMEIFS